MRLGRTQRVVLIATLLTLAAALVVPNIVNAWGWWNDAQREAQNVQRVDRALAVVQRRAGSKQTHNVQDGLPAGFILVDDDHDLLDYAETETWAESHLPDDLATALLALCASVETPKLIQQQLQCLRNHVQADQSVAIAAVWEDLDGPPTWIAIVIVGGAVLLATASKDRR